ncbi:hypothetical protein D3C72_2192720 [compost metagenome]
MPQDFTVSRGATTKIAGIGFVLHREGSGAIFQFWQFQLQQYLCRFQHFLVQRQRGVAGSYRHFLLANNVAGIRAFDHFMQRGTGFGFAINQRPVHRCAATVARQQ